MSRRRALALEVSVQLQLILAVDIGFHGEREGGDVIFAWAHVSQPSVKLGAVGRRLLVPELVTGDTQGGKLVTRQLIK